MPRFLADCNVGRLARWLRVLGYDAVFDSRSDDRELVARALAEGRVLLTRDVDLTQRRVIASGTLRTVLLAADRVDEQLRQVLRELHLASPGPDGGLTRCLECNVALEDREKAQVEHLLPPYVRVTQHRFSQCPDCGRVYWPGTHWERMRARIAALS
ncbi:MAG: Mut7-C RNAse domain-containing protein [Candidatus Dormibacteraeota bacterium]|nr:Mut7-C RNAse domain-containing protein [Candidatus Dormibacteraeota bacterium]